MAENVRVDQGDTSGQDTAVLLLAAAEELGLPAGVVSVDTTGPSGMVFTAPDDVVSKAGFKAEKVEAEDVPERLEGPTADFFADGRTESEVATDETPGATVDPANAPAKKTTAKKTAAKKTTAAKQE